MEIKRKYWWQVFPWFVFKWKMGLLELEAAPFPQIRFLYVGFRLETDVEAIKLRTSCESHW